MMEKINKTMEEATQQEIEECEKAVKMETMMALLLHGVNKVRYGGLKSTLAQNMAIGRNLYPRTTKEMLNIINTYSQMMRYKKEGKPQGNDDVQNEVVFAQSVRTSYERRDLKDITCYHCGENGHYAKECEKWKSEQMHTNVAGSSDDESGEVVHIFHQHILGVLSNTWLLLNIQSTVDQFINSKHMQNIKRVGWKVDVYYNAGKTSTNMQGMFRKIKVWYNPSGITNIISLRSIKSMFRVTYDSKDRGGVFTLHIGKEKAEFIPHPKGLH